MGQQTLSVPIFPLPDVVFFPNTFLPLHVFEPRYKEMVSDALEHDKKIGVVQLRPGWESDYYGNPPVYKVLGVGRIYASEMLEDGRYDILLEGLHRVQILSETMRGEYRIAEAQVLADQMPLEREHAEELEREYRYLLRVYEQLLQVFPNLEQTLTASPEEKLQPGVLADVLAALLVEDSYDKQSILNELDVLRRVRLVKIQVKGLLRAK